MALTFQVDETTAAQRRFPLYLVDAGDGITPETGEAAGQPQVSENGAAFVNTSATLTAIGNGSYYVELTAAELSTLGMLTIRYKSAATAEFSLTGQVVSFDPYDAIPPVDVTTWNGTTVATPNTAGVPLVDLVRIVGGLVPTPTTAGVPDVNVERWRDVLTTLSAVTQKPQIDVNSINDDVTPVSNLVVDYDGTGYNKSASTIGTTTTNTDMRGTDGAALATVLGALADAAADGDPTAVDTLMQYVKQLVNVLVGTAGVVIYPAAAAPGNGVSLAQVLRENFDDVTGIGGITPSIAGDAMDLVANAVDAPAIATDAIDADSLASDVRPEIIGALGVEGIADAGGSTSTIRDAALTQANDFWNGHYVLFTSGANLGRVVRVTDFDAALDDITFAPTVGAVVGAGDTYIILGASFAQADVQTWLNAVVNALLSGAVDSNVSVIQSNVITAGVIATAAIDADAIAPDAIGASEIATDAIGSDELATSAVDEIRDAILPTQNIAFDNIMFLFVAASDHVTPVTAASGTGVTRSIDGGAFGAGTGALAEIGNGIYQYDASAADMDGGVITFRFTASGGTPGAPDDRFITIVTGGGV